MEETLADEVTAAIALGGVVVGAMVTWFTLDRRIAADERLAQKKFDFDNLLAQIKFDFDRAQIVHRRRFEVAETLLADAYRFKDLMGYVRNGFSYIGEGATRPQGVNESEDRNHAKDTYFVLFDQAIARVRTASEMLIEEVEQPSGDSELVKQLKRDIWAGHSEARKDADQVGKQIEEGVSVIETLCRPILEWTGD